jgi:hypothetical protein
MRTLTIALLLLVNFTVSAKFYKGTILLMDGNTKKGGIELPDYPDDKKLKFRNDEEGKKEKIEIDLVKSFEILNDKNILVKYITIYLAEPKPFTKNQYKLDDHKSWVKVVKEGKINLYTAYSVYNPGTKTGGDSSTYIQKENDKYAYYIASGYGGFNINMNGFSTLKKYLGSIFEKDCPNLVQLIKKEEMNKKGYEYIVELYEKNCGQ